MFLLIEYTTIATNSFSSGHYYACSDTLRFPINFPIRNIQLYIHRIVNILLCVLFTIILRVQV